MNVGKLITRDTCNVNFALSGKPDRELRIEIVHPTLVFMGGCLRRQFQNRQCKLNVYSGKSNIIIKVLLCAINLTLVLLKFI